MVNKLTDVIITVILFLRLSEKLTTNMTKVSLKVISITLLYFHKKLYKVTI